MITPLTAISAAPSIARDRDQSIDALRGLAIGLILLVHLNLWGIGIIPRAWESGIDQGLATALVWFGHGKLYGVFAFLFGMSAAWLQKRGGGLWARRMVILAIIGYGHQLIWSGDILFVYGCLGLALPLVWHWSGGRLAGLAAGLLAVPVMLWGLLAWGAAAGSVAVIIGSSGGLSVIQILIWWPQVAAMILLGLAVGRAGILGSLNRRLAWGLAVGIPLAGLDAFMQLAAPPLSLAGRGVGVIGGAGLALGYVGLFMLAWPFVGERIRPYLAALGRMALTHYLCHTLIMLFLFDVVGLSVRPVESVGLWGLVVVGQAVVGRAWLEKRGGGPVELVWRRLAVVTGGLSAAKLLSPYR